MPAPKGNQYAAKPEAERKTGKGRLHVHIGDLKTRCVRAANARGLKLVNWVKEKLAKGAEEDGY